jgi:7-cyano-7-deazaguanine synthase
MKKAVLSFSGGMDSTGVLLKLLTADVEIKAISFDYGQKHLIEIKKAKQLVSYINKNCKCSLDHTVIKLQGLSKLLNSNLVRGGKEVPEGHYRDSNMRMTVVPNRNKVMSSIIQSIALSWANFTQEEVFIAMGIHSGDHEIYPDCRKEFRDADYKAFKLGNWEAEKVKLYTPFLNLNKFSILNQSLNMCHLLKINFNEVFKRTNTSYKPINDYSDYKSASSIERIEAFINLGIPDPIQYADETGPVDWVVAKNHALTVLQEGAK